MGNIEIMEQNGLTKKMLAGNRGGVKGVVPISQPEGVKDSERAFAGGQETPADGENAFSSTETKRNEMKRNETT